MSEQRTANSERKMQKAHVAAPSRAHRGQRGFTLLFAALIASIVLSLGSAIFEIAQKQVTLSSLGRDSQFAFYAADTIAECALYWDFRYSYFSTSTPDGVDPTCSGEPLTTSGRPSNCSGAGCYPYTITSDYLDLFQGVASGDFCAQVTVEKTQDSDTGAVHTIVKGDGYSTSCADIDSNPRTLQRSVELRY